MPTTAAVNPSGNQDIDGLLYDRKWAVNAFTFSFPSSFSFYESGSAPNGETTNNFDVLNSAQQNFVRQWVLLQFSSVINVTFNEITESTTEHADFRFAKSDAPSTAWAYLPSSSGAGGDSWYRNSGGIYDNPIKGNYAAHTFLHEFGHAMGLEHGHDPSNTWGVLPAAHDSLEYSVMTYRSYVGGSTDGYTYESWGAPQTLMQNDIAALQYLYGANFNTNNGNTTYTCSPTTGEMFINAVGQGAPGGNRIFMTLWDGGGSDTYDFSNYSTNLSINLQPGQWTTTSSAQLANLGSGHMARGNIANALLYNNDQRSLIENAIGGSGSDTIIGNEADNSLRGHQGNDTIDGLTGTDSAIFSGLRSAYALTNLGNGGVRVAGIDGTDTLSNVERLVFDDQTVIWPTITSHVENDSTGDGKSDILWRNSGDGRVVLWAMDGLNLIPGGGLVPSAPDLTWSLAATGDFNGDGKTDIVWHNDTDGRVVISTMNGTTLIPGGGTASMAPTPDWSIAGTGDFNGDGKSDLLWHNSADGRTVIWMMDGANVITGSGLAQFAPTLDWTIAGTGDFNADGKTDIVWRNSVDGRVVLWEMDGLGVIPGSGTAQFAPTLDWSVEATADFTGDGKADILWHNTDGRLVLWAMNGLSIVDGSGNLPIQESSDWKIAATGDLNGNHATDLIWHNNVDGRVLLTEMNGTSVTASGFGPFAPSLDWYIV